MQKKKGARTPTNVSLSSGGGPKKPVTEVTPYRKGYLDPVWAKEIRENAGLTVRDLATVAGYNSFSPLQRLLEGRRKLQLSEVERLAVSLKIRPSELLSRAGMLVKAAEWETVSLDATTMYGRGPVGLPGDVTVAGWVDSELSIHADAIGLTGGEGVPWSGKGKKRAVRFQTMGGGYGAYDGAMVLFEENPGPAAGVLGRICVVDLDGGLRVLRIVGRGMTAGRYQLQGLNGAMREKDVAVKGLYPCLCIRFPGAGE